MRFQEAADVIKHRSHHNPMRLKEVQQIILSMKPFDALSKLNVELFNFPHHIHSYADCYIDGKLYCFRFTPKQIFINQRKDLKNKKEITESLHIRKVGGYACSQHNDEQKLSKALTASRRDNFNKTKRDIERTILFRDAIMNKESYTDITIMERSFLLNSLVTYRSVLDEEFEFVFPLEVLISNLMNNKDDLDLFFNIVIDEKMTGLRNLVKPIRHEIKHLPTFKKTSFLSRFLSKI